jgi:hypothetical protein
MDVFELNQNHLLLDIDWILLILVLYLILAIEEKQRNN